MKLTTLKPRLSAIGAARIPVQTERIGATPRQRGRPWMRRRAQWLSEHPLCETCQKQGRVTAAHEVDHRTPLWAGGADDEANFSSLCVECHQAKTAREAADRGG